MLPTWSPVFPSVFIWVFKEPAAAGAQRSASVLRCGHDSWSSIVSHHQARWKLSENSRLASTHSARSATPSD